MAVYVDDSNIPATVGRHTSNWCHLFADTRQELHAFAARLGLRRSYFQGAPRTWHYDVTQGMRAKAVRLGACEVTWREAVDIMRRREGRLDKSEVDERARLRAKLLEDPRLRPVQSVNR